MAKVIAGMLFGLLAGFLLSSQFSKEQTSVKTPALASELRDIENIPQLDLSTTEELRSDRFASIKTIEDTLALPTDFAETEALYVIAGRSSVAELEALLEQADRIVERTDRRAASSIIISRLTELDPASALEMARNLEMNSQFSLQTTVWSTWGRLDLEQAVLEAQEIKTGQKNVVAQILYATVRDGDSSKMQHIQNALGVKPGLDVLVNQLYTVAERSEQDAINFIEAQEPSAKRNLTIMYAQYKSLKENSISNGVVSPGFVSAGSSAIYDASMGVMQAYTNPQEALRQYLEKPGNRQNQVMLKTALQNLMTSDPDQALAYLDEIPSRANKKNMAREVIIALAATEPERALEWVRDNRMTNDSGMLIQIFTVMASADPQAAFQEARTIKNRNIRMQVIGSLMNVAATLNPDDAITMLDELTSRNERQMAINQLSSHWVTTDFDQAVAWIATLDEREQKLALQGMQHSVVQNSVDNAIELLERFPNADTRSLQYQIVNNLVTNESIESAQAFVERYRDTEDYVMLQQSLISTAAYTDPDQALQLISGIPDGKEKDGFYSTIISQRALEDPESALEMLDLISMPEYRQDAVRQIAMQWYNEDPDTAEAWLQRLPLGDERDSAIVSMARMMESNGDDSVALIRTISDPEKRNQAMFSMVQMKIYQDPEGAEQLMAELDLSEVERAQLEDIMRVMRQ